MIQVASLKKTSKKTSASRKERHNRPAPLLPTFDNIMAGSSSCAAYQQPIAASPLDSICNLFASVIDQAGNEAVREWMTSAYTAMCNAICDQDVIATSLSSSHAVNEQLHGYVNEEYATAVRHKRQLEASHATLLAENNDLKRQIASLQTSLAAAAVTPKSTSNNNISSTSNNKSSTNGIVVSVSSMALPNAHRPPLSISIPAHNTQTTIEAVPTPSSSRGNQKVVASTQSPSQQQKSPVLESLPLRRSHSRDSNNNSTSPSSPSLSPAQADCMLRELEAKVALAIGSPLTCPTTAALVSPTSMSNEIMVSVTKLTRRNSGRSLRRSRSLGDEPSRSNVLSSSILNDNNNGGSMSSSDGNGDNNNMVVTNIIHRRSSHRNSRSRSPTDPNNSTNANNVWSTLTQSAAKQHRRSVSSSHCHQQSTQYSPSSSPLDMLRVAADQWVYA